MSSLARISALFAALFIAVTASADPEYNIFDIGVVQTGDSASQGFGVSTVNSLAVGRSFRTGGTQAFQWTFGGGIVGLPNLAGRSYCSANAAADFGVVVGTGATTAFGSGRLPLIWQNGVVSQLPLPSGQTLGDANSVNGLHIAVGSVNSGSAQRAVIYNNGNASVITQTTQGGSFFLTAFGINGSNRIVGQGIDPNNAARNVGIYYDLGGAQAFEVGALPGHNGALAFGINEFGTIVGASMLNQGAGLPFIWTDSTGMVAIPLPTGTSQGSARAVNQFGRAVGTASSAFAIPFLYDGTNTYRLADLIPPKSGWDLSTNTSSSALGISNGDLIVGTGVYNGAVHAYAMVPVFKLLSGISLLAHGSTGLRAIPFNLSGTPAVECRRKADGKYFLRLYFSSFFGAGGAAITTNVGTLTSILSGNRALELEVAGVPDQQTLTITMTNLTDVFGQVLPTTAVSLRFLHGDVNGSSGVNATDISQIKGQSGVPVTEANFRSDLDASGAIGATDISQAKANSGHTIP